MRSIYSGRKKEHRKLRQTNSLFQEAVLQPTGICLIERAADNLINFQAVVKKRLSKFELLKCCRIFQQRSRTDFVSNKRAQVLQRNFFSVQNELLCSRALPYTVLFSRKRGVKFSYDTFQAFGILKRTSDHK